MGLELLAHLKIQSDIFIPAVKSGKAQLVLPIHSANVWAPCINVAGFANSVVVPASAISPIQKLSLGRKADMLTAQAALGAGKGFHVTCHSQK